MTKKEMAKEERRKKYLYNARGCINNAWMSVFPMRICSPMIWQKDFADNMTPRQIVRAIRSCRMFLNCAENYLEKLNKLAE